MNEKPFTSPALVKLSRLVSEASEILSVEPKIIFDALAEAGIDASEEGFKLLSSHLITHEDISEALSVIEAPKLKMKAAVSTLRGYNPYIPGEAVYPSETKEDTDGKHYPQGFEPKPSGWVSHFSYMDKKRRESKGSTLADGIAAGLKEVLPNTGVDFKQLKDSELLELYIKEKGYEIEQELHRRAKNQPFIILNDSKEIDREASLDLLKRSRRMVNPTLIPIGDSVVPVYRITEVNPDDNIIEICPLCDGVLYKGYCDKCKINLAGIGDDERAYIHLVSKTYAYDKRTYSDRRHTLVSASKGIEDLKKTWPSVQEQFDELKLTGSLPSFKKIRPLPSNRPTDPFNVKM